MSSRRSSCSTSCSATPRTSTSEHDFGKDLIPWIVRNGKAVAHRFERSCVRSASERCPYWRDVGTVDAYWEANIDLTDIVPPLDLYDRDWPIWTYAEITPPAKFVHDVDGRRGEAISSLVSGGCIVSGAAARRSLLFTHVRLHSWAKLDGAVVLPQVDVGRYARLTNVVVDRGVRIPEGLVVGEDPSRGRPPLPPHRQGHLPHHPGDAGRSPDGAAGSSRSPPSASPWSRPAAWPMWSARCRRRWRRRASPSPP